MRSWICRAFLAVLPFSSAGQNNPDSLRKVLEGAPPDSTRLRPLSRLGSAYLERGEFDLSTKYCTEYLELARKLGNRRAEGIALEQLGTTEYYQGNTGQAMDLWQQAMVIYIARKDSSSMRDVQLNMANGYVEMGHYEEALRDIFDVLAWAERKGDRGQERNCLANIAMVYAMQEKLPEAVRYQRRVLTEFDAELRPDERGRALTNLGQMQLDLLQPDSAKITFTELMTVAEAADMKMDATTAHLGLGNVAQLQGDRIGARAHFEKARSGYASEDAVNDVAIVQERLASLDRQAVDSLDTAYLGHFFKGTTAPALAEAHVLLDSTISTFKVLGEQDNLRFAYSALSEVERAQGDYKAALEHHQLFKAMSDTLLNAERDRKLTETAMTYEFEKKEAAAKAEQEKKDIRHRNIRNSLMLGLALVIAFAGVFFFQRNRIAREKERSDELLLNILPAEVAEELKDTGAAQARHFDTATILFTDFKGFTQLSEKVTPAELVAELNTCFKEFDTLMGKYHIEKIKTIGDAYMAAGGLPDPQHGSAADVVRTALEMQAFMRQHKAEREAQGKPYFEMRVGIHTGPVVAGIVGVKKFQYDIWGDTVNTASRMESSGEVGQVNISEATYALVKGETGLRFTPRGKVQAKGKGEMEMYFVS